MRQFNNNRQRGGGSRFNNSRRGGGSRRPKQGHIDLHKMIRKAIVTEKVVDVNNPTYSFDDLDIARELKENIRRKGFLTPTPIQDQAIPHILLGKDTVGIANTGTGKTGAFLIPLLDKVFKNNSERVLIIAPTRELAEQINEELYLLTKSMRINSVLCVGGMNIGPQMYKLRNPHNFIIGTPGRLLDLVNRRMIDLSKFKTIVLDEVDRMLDMGFINDIKLIISQLPEDRHSMFFSATMNPGVERVMSMFVKEYVSVSVKTGETADNINQDVIHVTNRDEKVLKLEELLLSDQLQKVIIFVRTKIGVEKLDDHLYRKGFKVDSLHGNKTQSKRKRALANFKNGSANILVATDVAARGLDVPNVTHVINFDMPDTYEDYIHRIGRTGRASQIGNALTFVEGFSQGR
jgi:ATP-dependent RNA helicase RhlE